MNGLKFDKEPRANATTAYKHNELAATVRYDDERDIEEGELIELQDVFGEPFATAKVREVYECPVYAVIPRIRELGVRYPINGTMTLISTLNHYYDDTIWPDTHVKIIVFEVVSYGSE